MDKTAFLILAHNDPQMLKKLIYALDDARFDVFVHLDAKQDIEKFGFDNYNLNYSKLYVIENRKKVYWGDYSIVEATLEMYRKAFEIGEYSRFVTLSGNDYPLKSNDEIYDTLSDLSKEFIMGTPSEKPEKVKYFYFKKCGFLGKVLTHSFRLLNIVRNRKPLLIDGREHTIYFAPQWHAISNDAVKYLLNVIDRNSEAIYKYFKYSFASDELLIPTILFNNEDFRKKALKSSFPKKTHYNEMPAIHYIDYEPIVRVFDENDAEILLNSNKLLARKLRSGTSDALISIIDASKIKKTEEN